MTEVQFTALERARAVCGSWINRDLHKRVAIALLRERSRAIRGIPTFDYSDFLREAIKLDREADELERIDCT